MESVQCINLPCLAHVSRLCYLPAPKYSVPHVQVFGVAVVYVAYSCGYCRGVWGLFFSPPLLCFSSSSKKTRAPSLEMRPTSPFCLPLLVIGFFLVFFFFFMFLGWVVLISEFCCMSKDNPIDSDPFPINIAF